jgi:two-component system copper resistance phosphate regulon response regulator CusR
MTIVRLLLVEDDKDLSEFIREGLSREGFAVDVAMEGQEAIDLAGERGYDVIVLDVMMPKMNGFAVLKSLRMRGHRGAVLMATSKGHEKDKLEGLNSGADDYIVKPFLLTELVARIRAVLRRTAAPSNKVIQGSVLKAAGLEMDLIKHEVKKAAKLLILTKKEFELLECFMRRPNQVLSQAVLAQHLTHADFDSKTNIIEVHIKNLRAKIDNKTGKSLIRTVRGCGYALDI